MVQNIILLTLDALSASHVGHLGYDRPTTPTLDEYAADWRCYKCCIAQSSHTRESMPSLFRSAYPTQLGSVGSIPADHPTVPEQLSAAGFRTAGFHSNPYLSRAYRFDRGFDTFDDGLSFSGNRLVVFFNRVANYFQRQPYTRAETLTDRGLSWLADTSDEPQFLWLHYMDPHGPYQPLPRYQREFRDDVVGTRQAKQLWRRTVDDPTSITAAERETLVDLYDAEIRYTDAMISRFVTEATDRGLLDDALLIIAADHGDLFGEHGKYGHPRCLYEQLIHVPLLVRTPDGERLTVDKPVENIDIGPTILDAADVERPSCFEGDSLVSASYQSSVTGRETVISEARGEDEEAGLVRTTVRTATEKLHVTAVAASEEVIDTTLYDLAADPEETTPVDNPATHDRLDTVYRRHRSRVTGDEPDRERDTDEVDGLVADRLEDLGYR